MFWGSKNKQTESFAHLKKSLAEQKEWIEFLNSKTEHLTNDANHIKHHHINHKSEMQEHLHQLHNWISYLNQSNKKLSQEIEGMEKNIKNLIKKEMHQYHDELLGFLQETMIQEPAIEETSEELPVIVKEKKPLTQPEKELVNFLFNENQPLTYEDIANKTKKSINTVRVYMNALKKKDIIEEFKKPNGIKIFSLANKERVQTLYNI